MGLCHSDERDTRNADAPQKKEDPSGNNEGTATVGNNAEKPGGKPATTENNQIEQKGASDEDQKEVKSVSVRDLQMSFTVQVFKGGPPAHYKIEKTISGTIFGNIILATDQRDGSKVAVKASRVDSRKNIEDPLEEVRLMQMVQAAWAEQNSSPKDAAAGGRSEEKQNQEPLIATATHPNITCLHAAFLDGAALYSVFEFCGGGDLFDFIVEKKTLSEAEAKPIFRGLADGLHFLHSHGVCHLDFGLENSMLASDRKTVKIIDFGAARELIYDEATGLERRFSARCGAPGKKSYMAPELYLRKGFYGTKVDSFSLGVCLFILLVGKSPFKYAQPACMFYRYVVAKGVKALLDHFRVDISTDAVDLMQRLILADASRRLGTGGALEHKWLAA
mmetsp:Transcript_30116/g.52929  ORF Transcript_30116/g.52929 Transcript_30116/m.52929 type:complete len:391 (-) Transcript_30116:166-1338(-)